MDPTNQNPNSSVWDRIMAWLRSKPEQSQEASQNVVEGVNQALPEALSGRQAVLRQREKMRQIDDILRGT